MNKNFLELKNIKKVYSNGFQAIFDLDLDIQKSEFIVFVGPSGCGKTTTIRMISGLETVSNGEIILDGRTATDLPARKRNVSMVFQNYALFPHLSVKENIAFTLKTRHVPLEVVEKKVKWAAKILKLEYLLNRKPAQLSGGQRQRVALGRAIVAEPKLFLMDEPLSNLDAKLRGVMRKTIRKLHDELKTTSIYVTHDQVEAMAMADRIVVMSDGFIQQVGTPEEVFETPANKFVADFIGAPSINMIKGEIKGNFFETKYGKIKINKKDIIREKNTKKAFIGIRPQYSEITDSKTDSLKLNVDYMEVLGAQTIVHTLEKIKIVIDTENKPKKGQEIYIKPKNKKVALFNIKTGLCITSPINKPTMKSLETFYKSEELIKRRSQIMAKKLNKKVNEGLYSKITSLIYKRSFPEYIILNPKYLKIKENIRSLKNQIKDSIRLKDVEKLAFFKKEVVQKKLELNDLKQDLRKHFNELKDFNKIDLSLQKIIHSFQNKEKSNKQLKKYEDLNNKIIEIKSHYEETNIYNFEDIKSISEIWESIKGKVK